VFNLIFAVQTVLDLVYLWGGVFGGEVTLPNGMSWAEYAQRGAYPLLVSALLAGAFVLITFRPGDHTERMKWARRLVYLWLAQNVLLVAASVGRLAMYVDVYSLTRLRLAAAIWMALVAMGLVWVIVRIVTGRTNRWLVNINAGTAAAAVFVCLFVNFDGMIAGFNVRHCQEIDPDKPAVLDVAYLEQLGVDALPALKWYTAQRPGIDRHEKHAANFDRAVEAAQRLEQRIADELANWRGWTWRRARIASAVGLEAEPQAPAERDPPIVSR
jgi:hypothetical protein